MLSLKNLVKLDIKKISTIFLGSKKEAKLSLTVIQYLFFNFIYCNGEVKTKIY
jgi:hypothetical protein